MPDRSEAVLDDIETPSKSALTRSRILDAAAQAFKDKGFAATRLNDIADAAQLRAASIYYYFESKEELLEAVLDIGIRLIFDGVRQAVDAVPAPAGPRQRIRAGIHAHLALLLQHEAYASANIRIFGQIPEEIQQRNLQMRRQYGDYWNTLLVAARDAGELRADVDLSLARMLLFGALNWTLEWYEPAEGAPDAIADHLYRMLFDGYGE